MPSGSAARDYTELPAGDTGSRRATKVVCGPVHVIRPNTQYEGAPEGRLMIHGHRVYFPTRASSLLLRELELDHLRTLPDDWDGYGAETPSEEAISLARMVLDAIHETESAIEPTRVVASAEGGVVVCFARGDRYADIECFNSGEMAFGTRVISTGDIGVFPVESPDHLGDVLRQLAVFLAM